MQLQNDQLAEILSHKLFEFGNCKVTVDVTLGRFPLYHTFCKLLTSKKELVIQSIFEY